MPLDTNIIQKRLASVPKIRRDNEAQNIINGATSVALRNLKSEGVLRLYEALAMMAPRIYSTNDTAAIRKLAANTQFKPITKTPHFGVNLVKNARLAHSNIQSQLTSDWVTRIYAAEKKRLSSFERLGFDGATVGRGQLGQPAYTDVKNPKYFKTSLETCLTQVRLAYLLNHAPMPAWHFFDMNTYQVRIPVHYRDVWRTPPLEDFVVAAYLAIRIATKGSRSASSLDGTQ